MENRFLKGANDWQLPKHRQAVFAIKQRNYCVIIPTLNEGRRIHSLLHKLQAHLALVDIIVADKGSTDGSTDEQILRKNNVRTLLTLEDEGAVSAQLRMAFAYALEEQYLGIITIDANDKDDVEKLPNFIALLEEGFDFVQASRYIKGGKGVRTPLIRHFAVRLIHAPIISCMARFHYTDTTQGYRAFSRELLLSKKLQIFRTVFVGYSLLAYISVKAPRGGFRVIETPVTRTYPANERTPTKISFLKGNLQLLLILFRLAIGYYDPKSR